MFQVGILHNHDQLSIDSTINHMSRLMPKESLLGGRNQMDLSRCLWTKFDDKASGKRSHEFPKHSLAEPNFRRHNLFEDQRCQNEPKPKLLYLVGPLPPTKTDDFSIRTPTTQHFKSIPSILKANPKLPERIKPITRLFHPCALHLHSLDVRVNLNPNNNYPKLQSPSKQMLQFKQLHRSAKSIKEPNYSGIPKKKKSSAQKHAKRTLFWSTTSTMTTSFP